MSRGVGSAVAIALGLLGVADPAAGSQAAGSRVRVGSADAPDARLVAWCPNGLLESVGRWHDGAAAAPGFAWTCEGVLHGITGAGGPGWDLYAPERASVARMGPRLRGPAEPTAEAPACPAPTADGWRFEDGAGRLRALVHLRDGLPHGPARSWYADGVTAAAACFLAGRAEGVVATWHPDGRPASRVAYRDGVRSGGWVRWHAGGVRAQQGGYRDGLQQGLWWSWREEGAVDAAEAYRDGVRHGPAWRWGERGVLRQAGTHRAGLRHGPWRFFSRDGSLAGEGSYEAGRRKGAWHLRTATGTPTTVRFENGSPVAGEAASAAACRPLPGLADGCFGFHTTPGLVTQQTPDAVARRVVERAPGGALRALRLVAARGRDLDAEIPRPVQGHNWGEAVLWYAHAQGHAMVPLRALLRGVRNAASGFVLVEDAGGSIVGAGTP